MRRFILLTIIILAILLHPISGNIVSNAYLDWDKLCPNLLLSNSRPSALLKKKLPAKRPLIANIGPGQILGDYIIQRELGSGGTAVIYYAVQINTGNPVVIKISKPKTRGIIEYESEYMRQLAGAHSYMKQHMPMILARGKVRTLKGELSYYVMSYTNAQSLADIAQIMHMSNLSRPDRLYHALYMIFNTAAVLQAMNESGYFHKDIKPENILMPANGDVILTDFGAADTEQYIMRGFSIMYSSPEMDEMSGLLDDLFNAVYNLKLSLAKLNDPKYVKIIDYFESVCEAKGFQISTMREKLQRLLTDPGLHPSIKARLNRITDLVEGIHAQKQKCKDCDLFSLGPVLYELITNMLLFNAAVGDGQMALSAMRLKADAREFNANVRPKIKNIKNKRTQKLVYELIDPNPQKRYESARHIAEEIINFIIPDMVNIKIKKLKGITRHQKQILQNIFEEESEWLKKFEFRDVKTAQYIERLAYVLTSNDPEIKSLRERYIPQMGAMAVQLLIHDSILNHSDLKVRENAVEILGKIKDPLAVPALIKCLGSNNSKIRQAAAKALTAYASEQILLTHLLRQLTITAENTALSPAARFAAIDVLWKICRANTTVKDGIPAEFYTQAQDPEILISNILRDPDQPAELQYRLIESFLGPDLASEESDTVFTQDAIKSICVLIANLSCAFDRKLELLEQIQPLSPYVMIELADKRLLFEFFANNQVPLSLLQQYMNAFGHDSVRLLDEFPNLRQKLKNLLAPDQAASLRMPQVGHIWGEYVITDVKRGGMGEVYFARNIETQREVVIKIPLINTEYERENIRAIEKEIKILDTVWNPESPRAVMAKKFQPYFTRLFGHGYIDRQGQRVPYVIQEKIEGREFSEIIYDGADNSDYVSAIIELGYAIYGLNVLTGSFYGDCKPGNIMISNDGRIILLDFGITGLVNVQDTGRRASPTYAAPEQYIPQFRINKKLHNSVDVYPLAVMLYQRFSKGEYPYSAIAPEAVPNDRMMNNPKELSREVDPDMASIIMRALEKDPQLRYQTPDNMIMILGKWLIVRKCYEIISSESGAENDKITAARALAMMGPMGISALLELNTMVNPNIKSIITGVLKGINNSADEYNPMTQEQTAEFLNNQGVRINKDVLTLILQVQRHMVASPHSLNALVRESVDPSGETVQREACVKILLSMKGQARIMLIDALLDKIYTAFQNADARAQNEYKGLLIKICRAGRDDADAVIVDIMKYFDNVDEKILPKIRTPDNEKTAIRQRIRLARAKRKIIIRILSNQRIPKPLKRALANKLIEIINGDYQTLINPKVLSESDAAEVFVRIARDADIDRDLRTAAVSKLVEALMRAEDPLWCKRGRALSALTEIAKQEPAAVVLLIKSRIGDILSIAASGKINESDLTNLFIQLNAPNLTKTLIAELDNKNNYPVAARILYKMLDQSAVSRTVRKQLIENINDTRNSLGLRANALLILSHNSIDIGDFMHILPGFSELAEYPGLKRPLAKILKKHTHILDAGVLFILKQDSIELMRTNFAMLCKVFEVTANTGDLYVGNPALRSLAVILSQSRLDSGALIRARAAYLLLSDTAGEPIFSAGKYYKPHELGMEYFNKKYMPVLEKTRGGYSELLSLGQSAVPFLLYALAHAEPDVRESACQVLINMDVSVVAPLIDNGLKHKALSISIKKEILNVILDIFAKEFKKASPSGSLDIRISQGILEIASLLSVARQDKILRRKITAFLVETALKTDNEEIKTCVENRLIFYSDFVLKPLTLFMTALTKNNRQSSERGQYIAGILEKIGTHRQAPKTQPKKADIRDQGPKAVQKTTTSITDHVNSMTKTRQAV